MFSDALLNGRIRRQGRLLEKSSPRHGGNDMRISAVKSLMFNVYLKFKTMAEVKLPAGIASISGKMGNYCFRTMKATGKVYMHPLKHDDRTVPVRKKTKTVNEVENQERFAKRSHLVNQMLQGGSKLGRKELWALVMKAI